MSDLAITVAIIGVALAFVPAIVSNCIAYLALRRTPKLPEPPITPVCTTILGASMDNHISDLPTLHRGMGFDR